MTTLVTKKTIYLTILIVSFSLIIAFIFPNIINNDNTFSFGYKKAEAQYVFGGTVSIITYCPCSGNFLVYIGPPRSGTFTYTPGRQGYANFNMPFARYALGLYNPVTFGCWFPGWPSCYRFGAPRGDITRTTGSSI